MREITRRSFLKQAGFGLLGMAALLGRGRAWLPDQDGHRCAVCGALFQRAAAWTGNTGQQYFCPACGVNLHTGRQQLDWLFPVRKAPREDSGKAVARVLGELPFPNPKLVIQTDKPLAGFTQLRFTKQKGITGV